MRDVPFVREVDTLAIESEFLAAICDYLTVVFLSVG